MLRSPLVLDHSALSPRAVVFARLLTGIWLVTGHIAILPDVGVPLVSALASWKDWFPWTLGLAYLSIVGVLLVWLTPWVRIGCALVSSSIFLAILGDAGWFSNNRLLTALLLVLTALMRRPEHDRWLIWQLAIVWFGAAWDKSWSPEWRSGQVLAALTHQLGERGQLWAPGGASSHPTLLAAALSPVPSPSSPPVHFTLLSWAAIALEWLIALSFACRSRWVLPLSAVFFIGLVALSGSSMGMFVYIGLLGALLLHPRSDELQPWLVPAALLATPLFSWPVLLALTVWAARTPPIATTR